MWYLNNIPTTAHVYWGSTTMSWLRFMTIKTFSVCNPDWEIRVYRPTKLYSKGLNWEQERIPQVGGHQKDYFPEISKLPNVKLIEVDFSTLLIGDIPEVFRSDLLRLKLLGTVGGLWMDMDVITFKPMSEAWFNVPENREIDTVISYSRCYKHYSIGYMMGCENNVMYGSLFGRGVNSLRQDGDRQTFGVILWESLYKKPENINERHPNLRIFNIDFDACYYFNYFDLKKMFEQHNEIRNEKTIAIHWYGGHPIANEWESRMTAENYTTFNNTISNYINRVIKNG